MLGAAGQLKAVVGGLDLAVELLVDGEQTVLLFHLSLGESVGLHLITQQPGDVGSRPSSAGSATGTEFTVRLVRSLDCGLGDQLQLRTTGGVSNQQVHSSDELIGLRAQVARHGSIVDGLYTGYLDAALAILESLADVLELGVGERGTEDGGLLSVDHEATVLDGAGHPT